MRRGVHSRGVLVLVFVDVIMTSGPGGASEGACHWTSVFPDTSCCSQLSLASSWRTETHTQHDLICYHLANTADSNMFAAVGYVISVEPREFV